MGETWIHILDKSLNSFDMEIADNDDIYITARSGEKGLYYSSQNDTIWENIGPDSIFTYRVKSLLQQKCNNKVPWNKSNNVATFIEYWEAVMT